MIQGVGSSQAAALQASTNNQAKLASSGGGALPDVASPFEIAQQIQDVQVDNLKRTLDAQTLVLDLLA